MTLRVAYFGNFEPRHSTETHIARALENIGVDVFQYQENVIENWRYFLGTHVDRGEEKTDLILWTRTGWDWTNYGSTQAEAWDTQRRVLAGAKLDGVPVIGYHLDIWWGLPRQSQIIDDPFFRVDLLITADGGHDQEWADAGVNHFWFPPGVSRDECEPGMFRDEYHHQLAFIGSWQGGYHPESRHRAELVNFLRHNFRDRCVFYPEHGRPAVRNEELRDLYASTRVNIGDSAFAGQPGNHRYVSDRLPETLGRGGLLIHPRVPGITDGEPWTYGPTWTEDEHLLCWDAGDWDALGDIIDWALEHPGTCATIAAQGKKHTLEFHTYETRMTQLIQHLEGVGLL